MGRRNVVIAVLAAAALFGAAVSGCNGNRGQQHMADASGRGSRTTQSRQSRNEIGPDAARPAEVLSASAHRIAPVRTARRYDRREYAQEQYRPRSAPVPVVRSEQLAHFEPLPEPVPVNRLREPQAYQLQTGPGYAESGYAPVYNRTSVPAARHPQYVQSTAYISAPYTLEPSRTRPGAFEKVYENQEREPVRVHPSPALTMAQAQLQGSAPLSDRVAVPGEAPGGMIEVPLPTPESFPVPVAAPLPELEPVRYYSRGSGAVPPVAAVPAAVPGWIPSPVTAMRGVN